MTMSILLYFSFIISFAWVFSITVAIIQSYGNFPGFTAGRLGTGWHVIRITDPLKDSSIASSPVRFHASSEIPTHHS
jgi:hypothetical protein